VYQKLIDRTRAPLDLKQVKTIFGFSHRPHKIAKRGRQSIQVVKAVEAPSYDLTVNSGNLSNILPLRKSLTLWATTSMRSTRPPLSVDLERQISPLDLETGSSGEYR
jgi:hypothetical protein